MNINVQVVDMLINNFALFNQHVFHFIPCHSQVVNFNEKRQKSENLAIRLAEEMILTQFTNGNSHFHRSTFKGGVASYSWGFYDTICIFADFLMDDAALVAIVGSGEVTPIHLIICICRKNSIQVSRIVANVHACAPALLGFFSCPLLAASDWPKQLSLKSRTGTRIPCCMLSFQQNNSTMENHSPTTYKSSYSTRCNCLSISEHLVPTLAKFFDVRQQSHFSQSLYSISRSIGFSIPGNELAIC